MKLSFWMIFHLSNQFEKNQAFQQIVQLTKSQSRGVSDGLGLGRGGPGGDDRLFPNHFDFEALFRSGGAFSRGEINNPFVNNPAGAQQNQNRSFQSPNEPSEQNITRLMEMGFPRDQVVAALTLTFNDHTQALNYLLDPMN
jgi:hypothetical protein